MINKNKLIIFPILAVSAIFLMSTLGEKSADLSPVQNLKEEAYTLKTNSFKNRKLKRAALPFKSNKRFVKAFRKNNLSLKIAAEAKKAQQLHNINEENKHIKAQKKKNEAVASKKKKEEQEGKKADQKKKDAKKTSIAKTLQIKEESSATFSSTLDTSKNELIKNDSSLISSTSLHNTQHTLLKDESDDDKESIENNSDDTNSATNLAVQSNQENTSLNVFSNNYFKNLVENNKLSEFREALNLELTQEQKNAAYSEALSFLFTQENEDFILFDNFIKSNFLEHRFSLSIANSFKNTQDSAAKIDYSAGLLNQLVFSWSFDEENSSELNSIYQVASETIPEGIFTMESISTLKDNIASASQEFSRSSLEVSVN